MTSNWTCPYCDRDQVITSPKYDRGQHHIDVRDFVHGEVGLGWTAIVCANTDCRSLSLDVRLIPFGKSATTTWALIGKEPLKSWRLMPASHAKPQPDYVPFALRQDYEEACAISELSPKASATLARRCLQGMIRDFCGITKGRLIDEISALREAVDQGCAPRGVTVESIEAIDQVRGVGNIGAHMERDINLIVPVSPDEAKILIGLIEMLFDEWYIQRHQRQKRLKAVEQLANSKKAAIAAAKVGQRPARRTKRASPDPAAKSNTPDAGAAES